MTLFRTVLNLLIVGTAAFCAVEPGSAQSTWPEFDSARRGEIPYHLPDLAYTHQALEPYVRQELLSTHLDSCHATYVLNLNKAIGANRKIYLLLKYDKFLQNYSPDSLVKNFGILRYKRALLEVSEDSLSVIWTNALGHFNHSFFWQCMSPKGGGQPTGELGEAIRKQFGSFSSFNEQFLAAVGKQAGNGWVWLVLDAGKLQIETTQNENCPLTTGREVILGVDLWEHAYRSQYEDRKLDYVKAWFNVVNWEYAAERYRKAEAHPNTAR